MIYVNGEPTETAEDATVARLLGELDLPGGRRGVAVAVDAEVVPRAEWDERVVAPGSHVEIVNAVQGG